MYSFRFIVASVAAVLLALPPGQPHAAERAGSLLLHLEAADDALARIRVEDTERGMRFSVYHDAGSASLARAQLPYLAAAYARIAELVGVDPAEVDWDAVVFTQDPAYRASANLDGETRWKVPVAAGGRLDADGEEQLFNLVPHEQVHATQRRGQPRWFNEGQAEWAGLKITEAWRPTLARADRTRSADAVAAAKEPLALARWGGVSLKPEAILRQLTPEQRKRFETDPDKSWISTLAFSFGPGDYASEESNIAARYGAAAALFDRLEAQAGMDALRAWFREVRALPADGKDGPGTAAIVALVSTHCGTDIAPDLR